MARRDTRVKAAPEARPSSPNSHSKARARPHVEPDSDDSFAAVGEFLRKAALGLAAMLFVVRAYFPSEDADSGSGLVWDFAMLATSALAVASYLLGGTLRVRWSWADAAVLALMVLVGMSATQAADRRPAITMAWEWGSLGLLYMMVRNLPRSRRESSTMAGVMVATAVAVSAYGLYQIPVEFRQLRDLFTRNPSLVLTRMGIEPGSPSAEALKQRLLYSNEPFSTFALANSLAGFLVGPMALVFAVALENLKRDGKGSRVLAYLTATVPTLVVLVCLVLTKSRSAYVGLFLALLVLAWRSRRALPVRVLVGTGIGLVVLVGALIVGGVASNQLDVQVLTESTKSLRYRWEYWVGAWGVITDAPSPYLTPELVAISGGPQVAGDERSSRTFWSGLGPANFATPYLRYKLPEASEEVRDPHNILLEVWSTAGVFAVLALLLAIGLGLRDIFGPARGPIIEPTDATPRAGTGWLLLMGGLGWVGVWAFGKLNPMVQGDLLARWLILGIAWGLAAALGGMLWRRREIPAAGLGVGFLAIAFNLLAAGGIGIPSVAMSLWLMIALGLNLREDRPCGRLRPAGGLGPIVLIACVWAALAGTFFGAVMPYWRSEGARALGDSAMSARPPAFEIARKAYLDAIEADHYNIKPFVSLAELELAFWRSPEKSSKKVRSFAEVQIPIDLALDPKWRNPFNLGLRRRQAQLARAILADLPPSAEPFQILTLHSTIVKAARWMARIYPTSPSIRAELAQASADIGMYPDAAREGKQALVLDGLTPHLDKKLPDKSRDYLIKQIPIWEKQAKEPPPAPPAAKKPSATPTGR